MEHSSKHTHTHTHTQNTQVIATQTEVGHMIRGERERVKWRSYIHCEYIVRWGLFLDVFSIFPMNNSWTNHSYLLEWYLWVCGVWCSLTEGSFKHSDMRSTLGPLPLEFMYWCTLSQWGILHISTDFTEQQIVAVTCPLVVHTGTVALSTTATVTAQKLFVCITQAAGSC